MKEWNNKFRMQCNECKSWETDIVPLSSDGYWDDGFMIECEHCSNKYDPLEDICH